MQVDNLDSAFQRTRDVIRLWHYSCRTEQGEQIAEECIRQYRGKNRCTRT